MSGKTNIEWTDMQWNPVSGCSKVSPGCAHCYAEALTKRYAGRPGWLAEFLPWTPDNAAANVVLHPERLDAPLHWRKPRRVFVNSMSDLFHEQVPDEFIDRVFAVMALTPRHTYQVLTKRPERMRDYASRFDWPQADLRQRAVGGLSLGYSLDIGATNPQHPWPLPNVWLGVSVENQHWADVRIPLLLQTPAAVRFVSAEPLLGPVDLGFWLTGPRISGVAPLDWVIVGGESGSQRRLMELPWARSLRDQCLVARVPFFFKQASGPRPGMPSGDPSLDAWSEFPQ